MFEARARFCKRLRSPGIDSKEIAAYIERRAGPVRKIGFRTSRKGYTITLQQNSHYVFPEKKLRGLSPNFHIHVSVSDLNIPRIGPHIFLRQNRHTNPGSI
jgi:hypothetical protein